MENNSED